MFQAVFASRFVLGARRPACTACGSLGAGLGPFLAAAVVATSIWTTMLFGVPLAVGEVLVRCFGPWRWAGAAGFAAAVMIGRHAAGRRCLRGRGQRRRVGGHARLERPCRRGMRAVLRHWVLQRRLMRSYPAHD